MKGWISTITIEGTATIYCDCETQEEAESMVESLTAEQLKERGIKLDSLTSLTRNTTGEQTDFIE